MGIYYKNTHAGTKYHFIICSYMYTHEINVELLFMHTRKKKLTS